MSGHFERIDITGEQIKLLTSALNDLRQASVILTEVVKDLARRVTNLEIRNENHEGVLGTGDEIPF